MTRDTTSLTLEAGGVEPRPASASAEAIRAVVRATASAVELTAIAAMWLLLPAWPLLATAITRDGGYARRYWTTLVRMTRHIRAQRRSRSIARMVTQRLTPRRAQRAQPLEGRCTHCGRCCLDRACLFLAFDAQGRSTCRIYGSRLWRWSSCGRYPSDARDITLYDCPSFSVIRGPALSLSSERFASHAAGPATTLYQPAHSGPVRSEEGGQSHQEIPTTAADVGASARPARHDRHVAQRARTASRCQGSESGLARRFRRAASPVGDDPERQQHGDHVPG